MTPTFIHYALSLGAAFLYVAGVLSLKRAADLGVGLWHSTVLANVLAALIFQGLLVFGGTWPPLTQWWQPLVVALLFISGQIWTLFSLQRGDVSVATPVLGLKIILVAFFTTLVLGQSLSLQLWMAAAMATGGVALLSYSRDRKVGASVKGAIVSALLAAASFALFDVLVQKWSPVWGFGRFLPVTIGMVGVLSLALIPLCPSPFRELPRASLRWLWLGASLFALQSLVFVSGVGYFGAATTANVIYSSRGLWSVIAVLLLGHLFHSTEKQLGADVLRRRLFGAGFMFAAILLVILKRH